MTSYTKSSLPTYHDRRLHDACLKYGSLFESFTAIEKYNILAAIGMWGEYWESFEECPLDYFLKEYCPVRDDTDAFDFLLESSALYSNPQQAMGLVSAIASQISEGIWLKR